MANFKHVCSSIGEAVMTISDSVSAGCSGLRNELAIYKMESEKDTLERIESFGGIDKVAENSDKLRSALDRLYGRK